MTKAKARPHNSATKGQGNGSNGDQRAELVVQGFYLGVKISLYWSFSTRVVAATDIGMTMLLISKELSPLLLLTGCCKTKASLKGRNNSTHIKS